jgi:hypothetical protein
LSWIGAPGSTTRDGVVRVATGVFWMDTVTVEGALTWPRLSVTTSWNVTDPDVLGTVTETLGLVVEIEGLLGESGVEVGTTMIGVDTMGAVVTGVVATGVVATGAVVTGAVAMGAVAIGAVATGAAATGAVAIGAVATGAAPMVVVAMGSAVTPSAAAGTAVIGSLGGVAMCLFLAGPRYQLDGCKRVQRYEVMVAPGGAAEAPPSNKMGSPGLTAAGAVILAIGLP